MGSVTSAPGVVVLGGTGGIGRAIVERFASAGSRVLFTYLKNEAEATEIEGRLDRVLSMPADVTDEASVRLVVEAASRCLPDVRVVVSAAGYGVSTGSEQMRYEVSAETIETHLLAPLLVAREFGPVLRSAGGALVFLGSLAGVHPEPRAFSYVAAKAGVVGLTKALALDLAPTVRVNSVAPGWITTDRNPRANGAADGRVARIPLRRLGTADDVARAVEFLADPNGYVTGQTLVVDGGIAL